MCQFDLIAILIVLVALFSYLNTRLLRLPPTVGLMAVSLLFSAALAVIGSVKTAVGQWARGLVERIDLSEAFLHGMLGFLLFAGSLHGDLGRLSQRVILTVTYVVVTCSILVQGLSFGPLTRRRLGRAA